MLYSSTTAYSSNNCSTGCPMCGCSNPACRYNDTTSYNTNYVIVSFPISVKKQVSVYRKWVYARSLIGMLFINQKRKRLIVGIAGRQVGSPRSSRWSRYRK